MSYALLLSDFVGRLVHLPRLLLRHHDHQVLYTVILYPTFQYTKFHPYYSRNFGDSDSLVDISDAPWNFLLYPR